MKNFIKKLYTLLLKLNCYFLVLAAIFLVINSEWGSPLFIYTSVIGLIDNIKSRNKNGIIVNSTFATMNTYFVIMS